MAVTLKVNGAVRTVPADVDTPLLYVLRNDLALNGAKYGCGRAQCGACTVLINGQPVRSCVIPVGSLTDTEIVTLEGLVSQGALHPLQQAFIDEQAVQCGYCISGMIMAAKALLDGVRNPTESDVRAALSSHLCRCGTHGRIIKAVLRAAKITEEKRA